MKEQVPWWKKGACVWSQQICCTLCFHATEPQSFISNRRTMITVSLSRARGYGRCSTHHIEEWTVGPTVLPPTPMIPPPPPGYSHTSFSLEGQDAWPPPTLPGL